MDKASSFNVAQKQCDTIYIKFKTYINTPNCSGFTCAYNRDKEMLGVKKPQIQYGGS